jgi:hypothetical protein
MAHQPQVVVAPTRRPMSKWWWIGLLIAWIIFVLIGGALIGVWASKTGVHCGYYTCSVDDLTGEYYGGLACFAIGGILHLAYWIVLIVWCTKRHRYQTVPVTYISGPSVESAADKPFYYPTPTYYPNQETPNRYTPEQRRFCGNCGTTVTSQFCTQCGARI